VGTVVIQWGEHFASIESFSKRILGELRQSFRNPHSAFRIGIAGALAAHSGATVRASHPLPFSLADLRRAPQYGTMDSTGRVRGQSESAGVSRQTVEVDGKHSSFVIPHSSLVNRRSIVNSPCQILVACQHFAKADKSAHDEDINLDGALASQDAGEHGHTLLSEGIG
jgi:hypothetical protein